MRKLTAPVLLIAIALTGCAGSPTGAPATDTVAVGAKVSPSATPDAPVIAKKAAPEFTSAERQYLEYIKKDEWLWGERPSDSQLVNAGHAACSDLRENGYPEYDEIMKMRKKGIDYYEETIFVLSNAQSALCPELIN